MMSRWFQKDRRRTTFRVADPDFPMKLSLDRQKQPPYTPTTPKATLFSIQSINTGNRLRKAETLFQLSRGPASAWGTGRKKSEN
jgi:hypothetical protein